MNTYDWKKALDYVVYVASKKNISQATLAADLISLSHFNKMCNGKENINPNIVLECANRAGVTDSKVLEIARSQKNVLYLELNENLEQILLLQNYQSLLDLEESIIPYKDSDKYFTQLYYRIIGLKESILYAHYDIGLHYFELALKVMYSNSEIKNILIPSYHNLMDLEIIYSIAICYKELEKFSEAIEIYLELVSFLERNKNDSNLYPRICYNLARTYEKINDYENELKYANMGISFSLKHQIYDEFGYLYFSKAIAEYYLEIDNQKALNIVYTTFSFKDVIQTL